MKRSARIFALGLTALLSPAPLSGGTGGARVTPICHDWSERFPEAYSIEFRQWINSTKAGRADGPNAWDGCLGQLTAAAASKARDG